MKKRLAALIMALVLALALTACGKSEAAKAVDDMIDSIGEVTVDSGSAITAAEEAFAALSAEDQKDVNQGKLQTARDTYEQLLLQVQADEVMAAISAIGTVSAESAGAVDAARALYDSCDPSVQALVTNAGELEAAESALSEIQVKAVSDLISAIGEVSMDSAGRIEEAQKAFDALSAEDQAKVTNAADLNSAAEQLVVVKKAAAEQLLAGLRKDEDKVRGLAFYYPSAFPFYSDYWAADQRSFVLPYLGKEGDRVWLRLVCNYTADDWVFFKQITFAVDDERYTKYFNYFDVTRDNAYGDVWEYIDVDVSESNYEEILSAIADSNETIIRFEGDNYYRDFTVSAGDKEAIRQMLTVYQALK